MEGVCGRGVCVTASLPRSARLTRSSVPVYRVSYEHLTPFPSQSHLFSYQSPPYAKTLRARNTTKPAIFLPHLIASLVYSFSLSQLFQFSYSNFSEPICNCYLFYSAATSWPGIHNGEAWRRATWPRKPPDFFIAISFVLVWGIKERKIEFKLVVVLCLSLGHCWFGSLFSMLNFLVVLNW